MPWYKSAIERYFGALNTQLLSDQPGKSFSNFMKQYDYEPLKNAVISFEALQEIMLIFIVDIHNQSSHPELKSPRAKVWSLAIETFPPALPPSYQELFVLIGSITTRKISRRGVELFGIIYNNSELASLRSSGKAEKTTIKYDPNDLSRIYVFAPTTHQFKEVPALNQEYTRGLTLWQHQIVKQLARQESEQVDIVALALAKEKIQRIVEREWSSSKKSKTRTVMARWKGIGRNNFNFEQVESSQQLPLCNCEEQKLTNSSTLNVMTGISDLGSAFNNEVAPPTVDGSTPDTFVMWGNNREMPSDGKFEASTTTQKKRQRSTRKKSTIPVKEEVSGWEVETIEWKPDLAGWDVSIGLPLGE